MTPFSYCALYIFLYIFHYIFLYIFLYIFFLVNQGPVDKKTIGIQHLAENKIVLQIESCNTGRGGTKLVALVPQHDENAWNG